MSRVRANHEQPNADKLHTALMERDSKIKYLEDHNLNLQDELAELKEKLNGLLLIPETKKGWLELYEIERYLHTGGE